MSYVKQYKKIPTRLKWLTFLHVRFELRLWLCKKVFRGIGAYWKQVLRISWGFYFGWLYFMFSGEDISFFLYALYPCIKEHWYYATNKQIHASQICFIKRYHIPTCFGRSCYYHQGVIHEYKQCTNIFILLPCNVITIFIKTNQLHILVKPLKSHYLIKMDLKYLLHISIPLWDHPQGA